MVTDHAWLPGPADLELDSGVVHAWLLALDKGTRRTYRSMSLLSDEERVRAERFHFQVDRDRFVVSRSVLRLLLGRYTGSEPQNIAFSLNAHGKPLLSVHASEHSVRFNLSHSGEYTLYAFSADREVGVDIERIRPVTDLEKIAAQVFTRKEHALIASVPDDEKTASFFRLWARKEALVKGAGHGLSSPWHEGYMEATNTDRPAHERRCWSVQDLHCAPNYAAAVATEGPPSQVICWQWTEPSAHKQ